jgi:hypothetical protein
MTHLLTRKSWGGSYRAQDTNQYTVEADGRVLYDGNEYRKAKSWFADQVGRRPAYEVTLKSNGVVARRYTPRPALKSLRRSSTVR